MTPGLLHLGFQHRTSVLGVRCLRHLRLLKVHDCDLTRQLFLVSVTPKFLGFQPNYHGPHLLVYGLRVGWGSTYERKFLPPIDQAFSTQRHPSTRPRNSFLTPLLSFLSSFDVLLSFALASRFHLHCRYSIGFRSTGIFTLFFFLHPSNSFFSAFAPKLL